MFQERSITKQANKPRTRIYGIGINDATYYISNVMGTEKVSCPYYETWRGMLERCYCAAFQKRNPTYVGCTVVEAWHLFSTFKAWMVTQNWQERSLDKDILFWGNKVYGPDTCLFVPKAINSVLALRGRARGPLPLGVTKITVSGGYIYYQARCSFYGKQTRIGTFKTVLEAEDAYKAAKLRYIAELAGKETDPKVKQALLALY